MARRTEAIGTEVISERMKIKTGGIQHWGRLVPEFDAGERGIGERKGRIVVRQAGSNLCLTRHPSEVIGWRLVCRCVQAEKDRPTVRHWIGEDFWARVEDSKEHDPSHFRVYAPDELTVDVVELEDVATAVGNAWNQNHIQAWGALATIWSAQMHLRAAKRSARDTALARPDVRATMGLPAAFADYLDQVFADGSNG